MSPHALACLCIREERDCAGRASGVHRAGVRRVVGVRASGVRRDAGGRAAAESLEQLAAESVELSSLTLYRWRIVPESVEQDATRSREPCSCTDV